MADELRESLIILSERGTPAGGPAVMERARAELRLPGPTLQKLRSPSPRRPRGILVAASSAAVVLLVIGIVWLAAPFSGSAPVAPVAPVAPNTLPVPTEAPSVVATEAPPQALDDPGFETTPLQEPVAAEPALHANVVTWNRLDDVTGALGGEGDQFLQAVVEGGPGYIAVGAECPGHCPYLTPQGRPSVGPGLDDWTAAVWVSADGSVWDRVPHDEELFGGEGDQVMADVARGGPGFVAVGWTDYAFYTLGMTDRFDYPDDVGFLDGEIWVSEDGLSWERVEDPGGAFTGPGIQRIEAVVAGGPGLVAVGLESTYPAGFETNVQAAVWTSSDGYTWEKASLDGSGLGTMIHDVAVGGPGLVAVGSDFSTYVDYGGPTNVVPTVPGDPTRQRSYWSASVWVSADGLSWERVSPYDPVFGGLPESHPDPYTVNGGPLEMWAVSSYDGGLLAAGPGQWDRGIWLSSDGLTWTLVDEDDPGWVDWVPKEARAFVIDGNRAAPVGILSEDGDLWDDETRRFAPTGRGNFYSEMSDVLVVGNRLLAVGSVGGPSSDFDAAIWVGEWEE